MIPIKELRVLKPATTSGSSTSLGASGDKCASKAKLHPLQLGFITMFLIKPWTNSQLGYIRNQIG
jgi:hypothetical protein